MENHSAPSGDFAWLRTPCVCITFLAVLLAANLFVVSYVSREQTVYFWDFSGYWNMSRNLTDAMAHQPVHALRQVLHSVAYDDYNLLPVVPISGVMLLLGKSRLAYELAIINTYLAGTLLTLLVLVRRLSDVGTKDRCILAVSIATLLLWSVTWAALLRGLPDLGGVVLINLILLVYFRRRPVDLRWWESACLGFLLAGLVLFRRWYAFWVPPFLLLMLLDGMVILFRERQMTLRQVLRVLSRCITTGSVALLVLLLMAWPFLKRVAATNYADIYSSYRSISGWEALGATAHALGLLYGVGFLASAVLLAIWTPTRRLALFLCLQMGLVYLYFTHTQFFGPHHLYLFLPTMILFLALFWIRLLDSVRPPWGSLGFGAFTLVGAGTLLSVLMTNPPRFLMNIEPLASNYKIPPLVREDLGELYRLAMVVDDLTRKNNDPIYVLSSSYVLNADHLAMAPCSLPLHCDLRGRLVPVMHIDKRDGFPNGLLSASLVVVADPVQLHLSEEVQRVITCPTESLLRATDLGRAFERLPYEFYLDQGVRVWIYRKTRAISNDELVTFSERLRAAYPDRPFIWKPFPTPLAASRSQAAASGVSPSPITPNTSPPSTGERGAIH